MDQYAANFADEVAKLRAEVKCLRQRSTLETGRMKSQDAREIHQAAYDVGWAAAIEVCASLCEKMPMGEILLAAGELTAGERRTARALQKWFAHKIRTRKQ